MNKVLVVLLLAASGAVACGSSPTASPQAASPVASVEAPAAGEACGAPARQAADRVSAVTSAQRACSADADCIVVPQGASCFDHCTTVIARSGRAALDAVVADVGAHECREFLALGCRIEVPPCAPPGQPSCKAGLCQ
jgi:hypothetical protein